MGFLSRCMLTLTGHGKNSLTGNLMLGSIVVFGNYPSVTGTKQPLTWRVLFSHGGKVLLITEHSITERLYHHTHAQANWEKSDLRQWLNGEFFEDTFTESEKKVIMYASSVSSLTSSLKVQRSAICFLKMNLRSAPVIMYLYSAKPRSDDFLRMKKMHAALLLGISMNPNAVKTSKVQVGGCDHLGL